MFAMVLVAWVLAVLVGIAGSRWSPLRPAARQRVVSAGYWFGVVAAVVIGAAPMVAGSVEPSDAPRDFSVARARDHVEVVAAEPHPVGSPAIERVRSYLIEQVADLGLEPRTQRTSAPDYYGTGGRVPIVNVMARIEGSDSTGAVAVVAHYDTVPETPGANDDSSGVAVVLEVARAVLAEELRNDVIVLFTDGEEPAPRFGVTAFVEQHPWFEDVGFVVNLEAIGRGGSSMVSELHGSEHWIIDRLAESAPHPVAFSFLTETTELLGGSNSDFGRFREAGVPGIELVYVRGSAIYHTPSDSFDRLGTDSLQQQGSNALGIVRRMASEDLSELHHGDRTFFTVGRHLVVRYPERLVPVIVVLGGVCLVLLLRRHGTPASALRGAGLTCAVAAATAVVLTVLWMVVTAWRDTMGLTESNAHLVVLVGLGAVPALWSVTGRRPVIPPLDAIGVVGTWWALGALTALSAPGVSYLFALPALVAALVLLVLARTPRGWLVVASGTVLVTLALVVPAIDVFYQFAQPRPGNPGSEVRWIVAVPALLISLSAQLAVVLRPRLLDTGRAPWSGEAAVDAQLARARTPIGAMRR